LLDDIKLGKIELSENNSISGLLRQVIAGRLDGAYMNVAVASFHLNNIMRQQVPLILDKGQPHTRSVYHASSITQPDIIQEFNVWLDQNTQRIKDLQHKWAISQ